MIDLQIRSYNSPYRTRVERTVHSQIFSLVFTSLRLNNRNDIVPCNQQYGELRPIVSVTQDNPDIYPL